MHLMRWARSLALPMAGSRRLARMAMMAMTTSSSIKVNARSLCFMGTLLWPMPATVQAENGLCLQNDEIVAMDDFALGNRLGADFSGAGACDAAGELSAIGVANTDDFARIESALHMGDSGQKEAAALFAQGFFRAIIDSERAGGAMIESDPTFAAGELARLGNEEGAFGGAGSGRREDVGLAAAGDNERDAGANYDFRGVDFGSHAADRGGAGGAGGAGFDGVGDLIDGGNELRVLF